MDIDEINQTLAKKNPEEIVKWALDVAKKPVITTNFRPYEVAILHLVTQQYPDMVVIWCDTGYNTTETYRHAIKVIDSLDLKVDLYVPKQTRAYRDVVMEIPDVSSKEHKLFTEQVKLEPFRRAIANHRPDVWFTNLRKGQTAFRDKIDVVSMDKDGIIKVSPFYHYDDKRLDAYLKRHKLPNEHKYFDPTKVLIHRECGLHT